MTSILIAFLAAAIGDAPPNECGSIALFHVLRFEGSKATLSEINGALPPIPPKGYSLGELRDGAARLGYNFEPASIGSDPKHLDRPMVALLDRESGGHFVAVLPAGHSGQLVQVIDPARGPFVVEKAGLVSSRDWTGKILRRPGFDPLKVSGTACLVIAGLLVAVGRPRRAAR